MRDISWKWIGLTVAMAACAGPEASAGTVQYEWAPVAGGGMYQQSQGPGSGSFESYDGYLIINYDPDNPLACTAGAFVGAPIKEGFGAGGGGGAGTLAITLSGDELLLHGSNIASSISVALTSDPGPLNSLGLPETLGGFLGQSAHVSGGVGKCQPLFFFFVGQAGPGAPEPSGLLILALGIGGIALARAKRRPGASSN
jgi:hypothetical protein